VSRRRTEEPTMRTRSTACLLIALSACLAPPARGETAADYVKKAKAALAAGDTDKALDLTRKGVTADPSDAGAHFTLATVLSARREPKDAVAECRKVLELDPKWSDAFNLLGGELFKLGQFKESVAAFDKYLEARPDEKSGHWQRGISLYYAGQYDEGRKQFEGYEKVDTNDVENAVWHFLCAAKADGVEKARTAMLKIGKDKRVPMTQVYDLYRGALKPEDVLAAAKEGEATDEQRARRLFYAHLYIGLYYDATGDKKQALEHLTLAAHKYRIDHYMGDVARVHEDVLLKEEKPK
jgi:lipoprotein NlpI